jgi:arabinofuranan 3-O-arabinosyltransferase
MSRDRTVWRLRLITCSLALAAVAFWQRPGLIAADTNLGLVLDPGKLLARSASLWQPESHFGHVGEPASHLFPTGPFFAAGQLAQVPAWVVQRTWWATVLVVAFLGVVRLTGALGVQSSAARVVAGFGYALAPAMLSELGTSSAGRWTVALAPWVLLPVVRASGGGRPRRLAAVSGLVAAGLGAVNPLGVIAVLVLVGCYLLFAPRWLGGWRTRGRFAAWWVGSVAVATAWWWGPFLLARPYAPAVPDWSVPAGTTTAHASLANAVRGMGNWQSYAWLGGGEPVLPGGWQLATQPAVIFASAGVAALGLAGLAMRSAPAGRAWLVSVVIGLGSITLGHTGSGVVGPFAEQAQALLDGPAAAMRTMPGFDVMLWLPLAIGLAHLVSAFRWPGRSVATVRAVALGTAGAVVLVTAAPALSGDLARESSFEAVPEHWSEVAGWLGQQAAAGRALLVPGASAGVYQWGTSLDEPLGALAESPWAVRDLTPPSSAGNVRLLDAIERRLEAGDGGPGLATALERAGVTHLVVRNDLDSVAAGTPRPLLLYEAIRNTPGLTWTGSFGDHYGSLPPPGSAVDGGLSPVFSAVDVFRVGDPAEESRVRAYPLESSLRVSGGPESLLTAADAGLLEGRAALVAGDGASVADPSPQPLITDGLRRRAAWFGAARNNTTETLRAGEPGPYGSSPRDYLPVDDPSRETVAVVNGVRNITASSSAAHPDNEAVHGPEYSPWAALDGEPSTAWLSGDFGFVVGQWLEVEFENPVDIAAIGITLYEGQPVQARATRLRVTTDAGSVDADVRPGEAAQRLAVPDGPTARLRVTVLETESGAAAQFGIRELAIPGVNVSRSLRTPTVVDGDLGGRGGPAAVVLTVADGQRGDCAPYGESWRCGQALARSGEEVAVLDRHVDLPTWSGYDVSGQVSGRPGRELERLIGLDPAGIRASASSRLATDPVGWAQSAVDGDPGTSWIAAADDPRPRLELRWPEERTVHGLELTHAPALPASRPIRLLITGGGTTFTAQVGEAGDVAFDQPVQTSNLTLEILESAPVVDRDPVFGGVMTLPPGISELTVRGAEDLVRPIDLAAPLELACGQGPPVSVNGRSLPTSVHGTVGDALTGRPLELRGCPADTLRLAEGSHHVAVGSTRETRPRQLTLIPVGGLAPVAAAPEVEVHAWEPARRIVAVAERTSPVLLTVPENANPGWKATLDGVPLASVRHDGWAQGYVVPPGEASFVALSFRPDSIYREILIAGVLGVLLVVAGAVFLDSGRDVRASSGRQRPRYRSRSRSGWLRWGAGLAAGVAALGVLGGTAGLVAAGAAVVAVAVAVWLAADWVVIPVGAMALGAGAGALAALRPWPDLDPGGLSGEAQILVLAALALAITAQPIRDLTRWISGVSMKR